MYYYHDIIYQHHCALLCYYCYYMSLKLIRNEKCGVIIHAVVSWQIIMQHDSVVLKPSIVSPDFFQNFQPVLCQV